MVKKFTNTHDVNNVVVTEKSGRVRVLKPGESCELYEKQLPAKPQASKDTKEDS